MARLTGQQAGFMRAFLGNAIERLGTMPPVPERDRTIELLRAQLASYPASNVIPIRGERP